MASEIDSTASIVGQAGQWWELLHGEGASSADDRDFGDWVVRSPERVGAYLQTARLIRASRSPELRWPKTTAAVLIREAKAAPPEPRALVPSRITSREEYRQKAGRFRIRTALAVTAVLMLALTLSWFRTQTPRQIGTAIGEQRSVLLEDGSRVALNTASRIEVDLRKERRFVRLIAGEVLFEVAHDATRPFEMHVGDAVLRDVGTQFNVDMRPSGTTVTVLEGQVAVDCRASRVDLDAELHSSGRRATQGVVLLAARDRMVISRSGIGLPQHDIDPAATIAWTQRQLIFEHRPLTEVAEEFNRYNVDRIELDSVELQRQEVTGVFQAQDPTSLILFLSKIPGVEIREGADGAHIVTMRKNSESRGPQGVQ